ncbi:MAG: hypothetical protein ACK41F_12520, partial [Fimbriimonadaceae bacterium]
MRKKAMFAGACAAVAVGLVYAKTTAKLVVERHARALAAAQSLTVEYTVQPIGGAPSKFTAVLAKPNL